MGRDRIDLECPKCNHVVKTSAVPRKPVCRHCGYIGPSYEWKHGLVGLE